MCVLLIEREESGRVEWLKLGRVGSRRGGAAKGGLFDCRRNGFGDVSEKVTGEASLLVEGEMDGNKGKVLLAGGAEYLEISTHTTWQIGRQAPVEQGRSSQHLQPATCTGRSVTDTEGLTEGGVGLSL